MKNKLEELVLDVQLKSESELEEMGYVLIDDATFPLQNNLVSLLEARGMTAADLARRVGVTRQSVSFIIRNKMCPATDFSLKAAAVLNESVENIFTLTEGAWIEPVTTYRESAVYLEMKNLEIIGRKEQSRRIKENGFEYMDINSGELLTKKQMDEIISTYKQLHETDRFDELKRNNPDLSYNETKALVSETLEEELDERYGKLYKRIGKSSKNN